MGTTDIALKRVFRELVQGNVGTTITEIETFLAAWPHPQSSEKLLVIKESYKLMEDYWERGVDDPLRAEQYQRLIQQLYVIVANISIHRHIQSSTSLRDLHQSSRQSGQNWSLEQIRKEMENFVSESAMLGLEPEDRRAEKSRTLYQDHHQQMKLLFNYVVTSHIWSDHVGAGMENIILSPTIDSNDQQLLVSAITLSLMNRFDMAKFRLLVNVYSHSIDEQVRQRALIGWVLSIDDDWVGIYPEERITVQSLLKSKQVCDELTELQIQLIYCMNVNRDTSTIEKEIIPDIIKNNGLRMTPDGIKEKEDDPMEDILKPGSSEERMEHLEASLQRMRNMERQGVDVYFSGFSQMKRFPFFYDMCNWLVPFYREHPDISEFIKRDEQDYIEKMVCNVPFCNSDKYSFLIAFYQMARHLPETIREYLKNNELAFDDAFMSDNLNSPEIIRRSYLMDLYRFFSLYPNRSSLFNPFDGSKTELGACLFFTSQFFDGTPLEERKREVVTVLKRQKRERSMTLLLDTFPKEMHDIQYYMWKKDYAQVLLMDHLHEQAKLGLSRELFSQGLYARALEYYDQLVNEHPEHASYLLGKAICLLKVENYEEALLLIFQLNYEHPEDSNILRVLAWALTCNGKLEQAENYYQDLERQQQMVPEDLMNYACCLWLLGKINQAADYFGRFLDSEGCTEENMNKAFNKHWLKARGFLDMDIHMMKAKVIGTDRSID